VVISGARSPLQVVDARDLGAFILRCAEESSAGSFDGVGPWAAAEEFLAEMTPDGVDVRLVDVDAGSLAAAGVELPLLSGEPDMAAFMTRPGTVARAAGLTTRPLADTAAATRDWDAARGAPPLKVGPSPEAEAELLNRWVNT
jgi:hypothetical protein